MRRGVAYYAAVFLIVFVVACAVMGMPAHHFKEIPNETRRH